MKRKIISVLLVTVMSFRLFACGTENNGEEATGEELATETETHIVNQSTESVDAETEIINEVLETEATETEATETETTVEESGELQPISYEDFNINGFGHSNYIDLYGSGNGYDDVERISIMSTNCEQYVEYAESLSTDNQTFRGIKLGDSREAVIAAYGEPGSQPVYKSKAYNHDGLESQYNMCYDYIDENYPEVFFDLSFSMDQNDNVLNINYEAILMKWYE